MSEPRERRVRRGQTERMPVSEPGASAVRRTERLDPVIEEWSQAEPVNPGWRSERSGSRRATRRGALPASPQEFQLWLQAGGWRYLAGIAVLLVVLLIALLAFNRADRRNTGLGITDLAPTTASGAVMGGSGGPVNLMPTVTPAPPTSSGAQRFVVARTEGWGLVLRTDHSAESPYLATYADGTQLTQIGADFNGPDRRWRKVRGPDKVEGWVAVDFLDPLP